MLVGNVRKVFLIISLVVFLYEENMFILKEEFYKVKENF